MGNEESSPANRPSKEEQEVTGSMKVIGERGRSIEQKKTNVVYESLEEDSLVEVNQFDQNIVLSLTMDMTDTESEYSSSDESNDDDDSGIRGTSGKRGNSGKSKSHRAEKKKKPKLSPRDMDDDYHYGDNDIGHITDDDYSDDEVDDYNDDGGNDYGDGLYQRPR